MRGAIAIVLAGLLATSAGCFRSATNGALASGAVGFGIIATGVGLGTLWMALSSVILVLAAVNEPPPPRKPK